VVQVMPRALTLMTGVFGNYVIQKFFEHGTAEQRRAPASLLKIRVFAHSLQVGHLDDATMGFSLSAPRACALAASGTPR
jgi:hypothetical protein